VIGTRKEPKEVEREGLLLALDFGGTKLTAGAVSTSELAASGERRWWAHRRVPSPPGSNAQSDLEIMMGLARDLLATAEAPLAAVGVSSGGPVDAARGLVLLSHHVPGWEEMPLREWLEERLGVPAAVDNDANAGALGEYRFGAGQGYDSLMYITVSTGVGGGWILNGQPWRGADGDGRRDRAHGRGPRRPGLPVRQAGLRRAAGLRAVRRATGPRMAEGAARPGADTARPG